MIEHLRSLPLRHYPGPADYRAVRRLHVAPTLLQNRTVVAAEYEPRLIRGPLPRECAGNRPSTKPSLSLRAFCSESRCLRCQKARSCLSIVQRSHCVNQPDRPARRPGETRSKSSIAEAAKPYLLSATVLQRISWRPARPANPRLKGHVNDHPAGRTSSRLLNQTYAFLEPEKERVYVVCEKYRGFRRA